MKEEIRIFKALSDPTRLRILHLLLERELCVCELIFILKMEQSRVSHQLRVLRNAGLVEDRREGKWIIYRIHPGKRKKLLGLFRTFLGERMSERWEEAARDRENLALCLEQEIRKKRC